MKIVCLLLVGIVVGQNLHRLRQVRVLVYLLILSGLAAVGFTAWQYTYGVGVKIVDVQGTSPLYQAHVYQTTSSSGSTAGSCTRRRNSSDWSSRASGLAAAH